MDILRYLLLVIISVGSGMLIAGAVFAFITIIGIVPRLAQKTKTEQYIRWYEEVITVGGILGGFVYYVNVNLNLSYLMTVVFGLSEGVFIGCLAVSLAEVLNVIPILARRARILNGMMYFVTAIGVGKMVGALLYFFVEGFH